MKKENLSDAFTLIDDQIIEDAQEARTVSKKYKTMRVLRVCIAACLVVVISLTAITVIPKLRPKTKDKEATPESDKTEKVSLPMLEISQNFGDTGFEGYMAHDISELVNQNPWSEDCNIKTLPVYKNMVNLDENVPYSSQYEKIDLTKMRDFILDVSRRFGLNENEINITQGNGLDSHIANNSLFVSTDNFEIQVTPELTATITFEPEVSLPQEYNFSYYANYDDTLFAAEYFKDEYKNVINFKSPKININDGSYNIYNQQHHIIEFFDDSGDVTQDIINYNFNRVAFYSGAVENNKLWMIRIFKPDLSQKIGDYPIITKDEATKLLSNGNYITSVPQTYEMKIENVKKVELVYRNTYWLDKIFMPYYSFYIELPELENRLGHGEKNYGIYYVPAVEGKYIKNMPVYDGSFN